MYIYREANIADGHQCLMGKLKSHDLAHSEAARHTAHPAATLGWASERGLDILCWCNRCGHNATVPTTVLARRLPSDCPVPEIGAVMRCDTCGSRDIATRPDWPSLGQVANHKR